MEEKKKSWVRLFVVLVTLFGTASCSQGKKWDYSEDFQILTTKNSEGRLDKLWSPNGPVWVLNLDGNQELLAGLPVELVFKSKYDWKLENEISEGGYIGNFLITPSRGSAGETTIIIKAYKASYGNPVTLNIRTQDYSYKLTLCCNWI